jgi:hypothetical protein
MPERKKPQYRMVIGRNKPPDGARDGLGSWRFYADCQATRGNLVRDGPVRKLYNTNGSEIILAIGELW